jgi:hypothetical protein
MELISSLSSANAMKDWPSPMVYFPGATPSYVSRSPSEMHWKVMRRTVGKKRGRWVAYPSRKVHFDAENPNIQRTGALGLRLKDGVGGRGEGGRGSFDSHGVKEEVRNSELSGW